MIVTKYVKPKDDTQFGPQMSKWIMEKA